MTLAVYTDYSYGKVVKYLDYKFSLFTVSITLDLVKVYENKYAGLSYEAI